MSTPVLEPRLLGYARFHSHELRLHGSGHRNVLCIEGRRPLTRDWLQQSRP
jgi:hypothetical protein